VGERYACRVREVEAGLHAASGNGAQLRARHELLHCQPVVLAPEHQRQLAAIVLSDCQDEPPTPTRRHALTQLLCAQCSSGPLNQ
jgi:hypothetical protein